MPTAEPYGSRLRLAAFVVLLVCLGGLLVGAGTITPPYPDEDRIGQHPDAYVGQSVMLGGTVVGTDPITIEADPETGESFQVTLQHVDESVAVGDEIVAFGTLEDDSTLTVERAVVRSPWEFTYMYLVSFIGGLWVLGRLATQWRIDGDRLVLLPGGDNDA
jgi:hypothetical protein